MLVSVSFFSQRHFTDDHKNEAHLPSAAASAGPSAATSRPILTVRCFPRSSRDRRRYAPTRSQIAIARGRRFHAQDRRVGASLRLTSRCVHPSPIAIRAAGAAPTPVARRLTPNGAARPVVSPSGHHRLPGACTRYAGPKIFLLRRTAATNETNRSKNTRCIGARYRYNNQMGEGGAYLGLFSLVNGKEWYIWSARRVRYLAWPDAILHLSVAPEERKIHNNRIWRYGLTDGA